jgi:hypothetical protein
MLSIDQTNRTHPVLDKLEIYEESFFFASIYMKRTQYAQSAYARVNQTRLCGVIGQEEEKKKWTITKCKRKKKSE